MAVTTSYWQCNVLSFPNMVLLGRNYCSLCITRCNKNLCLGVRHADYKHNGHLYGVQLGCNGRKLRVRASASGFEESDSVDNDAADDFWEKKEIKDKLKEMEAMKELIEEAEKLEEAGVEGSKEESEGEKKKRIRDELARRAREQAEQRRTAEVMFQMGQRAYGKGMYNRAVELFEGALTNVSRVSFFGGEIQLWLAMAYDAHNRHSDCIALYKSLEKSHPSIGIRKQAAGLRYILEAPKLKITKDEMVSIPLIASDYDRPTKSWSQRYRAQKRKPPVQKDSPPPKDYLADFLVWKPPQWQQSPYFWVAVTAWLTLVGVALVFQN